MNLLQNDADYTAVEVWTGDKKLIVAHCNKDFSRQAKHSVNFNGQAVQWSGPYVVLVDGKLYY